MAFENEEIIIEAVKLVDGRDFATPGDHEVDVAREAINLKRMLSRGSVAMRALSAVPLVARITDIKFEESSKRYLISFVELRSETGEVEHIRSDCLDGRLGDAVKHLWEDKVGKNVRIYKYLEATNDPSRPSVRTAPYVELL